MTESQKAIGAITLFVDDVSRSKDWYSKTFEVPVIFQDEVSVVFQFANTIINLLKSSEAPELIGPAEVGSGARSQFTIWVEDADAAVTDLETRGVELINGPIDREWGQRTACFSDPDGHIWEIAQHLE